MNTRKNIIKPKEFLLKMKKLYIQNNMFGQNINRIMQYYTVWIFLLSTFFEYTNPSTMLFWYSNNIYK